MGAPIGNKFWQLRAKHGRDKLFATPEALWDAACEYFQWCDDNPWVKHEQRRGSQKVDVLELVAIAKKENLDVNDLLNKSISDTVEIKISRPYTLTALCLYLGVSSNYFRQFKEGLKENDKDFYTVITRIEETIYSQKFEGASVGLFNANIIARDLGLSDKRELDHTTKGEKINIINLGNGEPITKAE